MKLRRTRSTRNSKTARKHTHEYRVRYSRTTWHCDENRRNFHRESAARRFVERLLSDGRPDLAPIAHVILERRPVTLGRWQEVPA